MKKRPGIGVLFAGNAKSDFLRISGQRYDGMRTRMEKKKLPPLQFTKEQFRAHILAVMGGNVDGALRCRYCRKFCALDEVAADHEMPLSRGGSSGLENLGFPCCACNARKGSMTPDEFLALLAFLDAYIPLARTDILKRLQQSIQLAAGARRNAVLIRDMREKKSKINVDLGDAF